MTARPTARRNQLHTFQLTITKPANLAEARGFTSNQFYASFRSEAAARRSAKAQAQPGDIVTVTPAPWLD